MGIKGLNKFLKNKHPNVFECRKLSDYRLKKVAVDISIYICKYKNKFGKTWISALIKMISCLRQSEIDCIMVFDGKSPVEKEQEKKNRSMYRERTRKKVQSYIEAVEKWKETKEIDPILVELYQKKMKKYTFSDNPGIRLLSSGNMLTDPQKPNVNMIFIESEVNRMKNMLVPITHDDFIMVKELLSILNIPYIKSTSEAETLCARLCIENIVDAVLSDDSDLLAYGTPVVLSDIKVTSNKVTVIHIDNLIQELKLSMKSFTDFCIMCGTDYNKNIFRVGPVLAYKYIKEYGDIDEVSKHTSLDISVLNHKRIREIFDIKNVNTYNQRITCGFPNMNELKLFLFKHNIRMSIENIKQCFQKK